MQKMPSATLGRSAFQNFSETKQPQSTVFSFSANKILLASPLHSFHKKLNNHLIEVETY
jgi:hypothetical protein